uniref:Myxococcus xanthus paralogous family TIGR02268 n=1 Tax=Stigmatella aurantiaca Sg a15 TaxID=675526 RepID=A0A3Q8I2P9_STIAU|nr:hypothetical protein [Stigmatella aurantiaca Sg a15]
MAQPAMLALAFVLFLADVAGAQPSPVREHRQRSVTVAGTLAEPPQEIRVAPRMPTVLLFENRIQGDAIEVDRTRIRVLDAGEHSIILEPLSELGREERLMLRVLFADGKAQAQASFVLVSHPTEVDTRVDITRRDPGGEACQVQLAEARERCSQLNPAHFIRAGWLEGGGIEKTRINAKFQEDTSNGLRGLSFTGYRAKSWVVLEFVVQNEAGPWLPREALIRRAAGAGNSKARALAVDPLLLTTGQGSVFVEVAKGSVNTGESFVLVLRDTVNGRSLTISMTAP